MSDANPPTPPPATPDDPRQPLAYESPDPERPATSAPTESQIEHELPTVRALDYSPTPPPHDPYAALRHRPYVIFSLGWMIAVVGNQMTAVALGWEIFDRTKSKLALGWLAGVQVIPLILLALPAGVLADRVDRRRLIQVTALLTACCSVGLAVMSYRPNSLPWMFALVTLSATFLTLGRPARSALLPNLVPQAAFSNAITWNSSAFQVSAMLGPAIGGLLIAPSRQLFHNLTLPYCLDAAGAILYAIVLLRIPKSAGQTHHSAAPSAGPRLGPLQQLAAGIRFVYDTKIILATLSLDLFAVLLGGAVYLLPVFAQDVLHVGGFRFGCLRAAEAIGAFAMAMVLAHLPPMKHAGRTMLLAVAMFGVATIVFGLSRNFWLSMFMLAAIGAFDNVSVVVRHTLVQILTPDAMRGRVSAVNNVFIGASNELGGLESGLTAEWLGPVKSVVLGGIGTVLTVLLTALLAPQLRRYGPLQPHAEEAPAPAPATPAPVAG
jgi:MFS family permease